jgi:hypothetical protein
MNIDAMRRGHNGSLLLFFKRARRMSQRLHVDKPRQLEIGQLKIGRTMR